eukprot:5258024-Ditylum_brightwellii.AAC.1
MNKHKLLEKLDRPEAELKAKQEVIKQQAERIAVLEKEKELLQADQNESKNIPILNDVRVRTSKGDWKEGSKAICKSEPHQLCESNKDEPNAFLLSVTTPEPH